MNNIYIVGMGGIGSWLVEPIARLASQELEDVRITLIDGDTYEDNNAYRQAVPPSSIGINKAEACANSIARTVSGIDIHACRDFVNAESDVFVRGERNWVITCVDNNFARNEMAKLQLLWNESIQEAESFFIQAGNEEYDGNVVCTTGNATIVDLHPEIGDAIDGDKSTMSCQELADEEGGAQVISTNFMAAAHVLNMFHKTLTGGYMSEVFFDNNTSATAAVNQDGVRI